MTIHRWEHGQRAISEERLEGASLLYGKTFRWFLTLDGAELEPQDSRHEVARRMYHRVAQVPRKYHTML